MRMTVDLEGRVNVMCNLSSVVKEKGIAEGIEKGKAEAEKKSALALLRKEKLSLEEVPEFFPTLSASDIRTIEEELYHLV